MHKPSGLQPTIGILFALLGAAGCGGGSAPVQASTTPAASATAPAPPPPPPRKGVTHDVATRLADAIEKGDASAAGATFAESGVLVRFHGADVRGPSAVEPVFRQAFGICKMHVTGILERESALVMQLASACSHPELSNEQTHLLAIDVAGDRIVRAVVFTELFGLRVDKDAPLRRELEDAVTLTPERERLAACTIDYEIKMLPKDFGGLEREVWATPGCTVLVVRPNGTKPNAHGYIEIECTPRKAGCDRSKDSRRYFDWNGWRLLPFADQVILPKRPFP